MRATRIGIAVVGCMVVALGVCAGEARPAGSSHTTISLVAVVGAQPALDVLIANFERVYPDISVNATYVPSNPAIYQLETTELGAGSGPDVLTAPPGCGTPVAVCVLAKEADLAPLIKEPWTRWSLPSVISVSKYGQGLYSFLTSVGPQGVFTNEGLFSKLGLKVPQTFAQLLSLCQRAKADGTVALALDAAQQSDFALDIVNLAVATVYGIDKHWLAEQKAGSVTFDGSAGWHQALQEVVDMNNAGCFQPGASGASQAAAIGLFAQGQALMIPLNSGIKSLIDADDPQFAYSFYPFPGGTSPGQTETLVNMGTGLGVNAHSSPQNQAAAQMFIDFIARPKQDALYAQIKGSLTQYEFVHKQIPSFMSSFAPILSKNEFVMNPFQSWWNQDVLLTLEQDEVGLLTGQETVDQVLQAMDAAWKQGPA